MYGKQKVLWLVSSCLEKQNFRASAHARVPISGHTRLMMGPQVTHERTRGTWGWGQTSPSTLYDTLRMPSHFLINAYLLEYCNLGMLVSWLNSHGLGLIIRCGGVGWRGVGAADVVQRKKKKSYFRKHFWRNGSVQGGRGRVWQSSQRATEAGWVEIYSETLVRRL